MNNRNDPCYCGSNKKYKKCCLLKDFNNEKENEGKEDADFQAWFEEDCKLGQQLLKESLTITPEV